MDLVGSDYLTFTLEKIEAVFVAFEVEISFSTVSAWVQLCWSLALWSISRVLCVFTITWRRWVQMGFFRKDLLGQIFILTLYKELTRRKYNFQSDSWQFNIYLQYFIKLSWTTYMCTWNFILLKYFYFLLLDIIYFPE